MTKRRNDDTGRVKSFSMLLLNPRRRSLSAPSFGVSILASLRNVSSLHQLYTDPTPVQNPTTEPLTPQQLKTLVLSQQHYHGRFSNLVSNVVASPQVLLAACQNLSVSAAAARSRDSSSSSSSSLLDSVSTRFSLDELARQLRDGRFDIGACCVRLSTPSVEPLVLPNLKLKVVLEAVRMVLEVIYDAHFVTFSYGGRAKKGRHTAIRYLKNSVENPNWWFTVSFNNQLFEITHIHKLCSIIEEKIEDAYLIGIIRRLFECEVVKIELGACYFGRGFPQESSLSSILFNVYFSGFDKELQHIRRQTIQESPRFKESEIPSHSGVFYRPVKIYAVRYSDEILVITSGSKMLTVNLKNWAVNFLEGKLDLKVDRLNTAIHSTVSEKIGFLGMVLQAVTPSVLHSPMSEKAIRARKKYLRQKEVKKMQLKNARETVRKKLGWKILGHVFKKWKQGSEFKYDIQIEKEVREIFGTWADEVVQHFLASLEDLYSWHRMLSAGDFLSLTRIRQQLPQELVDAYDDFQKQVDKHLNPMKARKALEEKKRGEEEAEQRKYAERTVRDLTRLCMKVDAPIELVRRAVRMLGFTNHMGRPRPLDFLVVLEDIDIIKWYAGVGMRWLDYFCCCHNFKMVKTVVTYHLRFSCILTLAEKHESTKKQVMRRFTKDLKVLDMNGIEQVHFPTEREVNMRVDKRLSDPMPVDGALSLALIRLVSDEPPYFCATHFCTRTDTIVYRVRLLQNRLNLNPRDEKQWVPGMGAIHESLNQKCVPLCPDHISDVYLGKITFRDIDCASFVNVD